MNAKELLEKAWSLIEDPANRCVGCFAQNSSGENIRAISDLACRFCASGALIHVDGADPERTYPAYDFAHRKFSEAYFKAHEFLSKAAHELFGVKLISIANDMNVLDNPPKLYKRAVELSIEHQDKSVEEIRKCFWN